jgi:hypothetical protein
MSRLLPPLLAVVDFKPLNALIHDVDKVVVQLNHHSVLVGRNRSSLEAPIKLIQIWIGEQLKSKSLDCVFQPVKPVHAMQN